MRIKILARGRSMSAHVWAFLTSRRRVPSSENLRCVKIFRLFWSIRAFPVRSRKKGRMYCLKISVSPDWKTHAMHLSGGELPGVWNRRALIREPKSCLARRTRLPALTLLRWVISKDLVRALRDRGIGVLISDHNVRETLTICEPGLPHGAGAGRSFRDTGNHRQ